MATTGTVERGFHGGEDDDDVLLGSTEGAGRYRQTLLAINVESIQCNRTRL
jgi:hypothetical protein